MENDTEPTSDIFCGFQGSDGLNSFDFLSQLNANTLEQRFPESNLTSKDTHAMVSCPPLSLGMSRLLPTDISRPSRSLTQQTTSLNSEWDFDWDHSAQLDAHYTRYQGNASLAGLYNCTPENLADEMHPPSWSEPFQEYPDLGQYDHQQHNLSECTSAFQLDPSTNPITGASYSNFNNNSGFSASTVPRLSPERPASAGQESDDLSPLSPADSFESYSLTSSNAQMDKAPRSVPDIVNVGSDDDTDVDSLSCGEPYARLIFKALKTAPDHRMSLKDIYDWFEKHTNKAKNSDSKGWQNSIRHNLSMNAAFEGGKETASSPKSQRKSGNMWVLTEQAIKNGVQSTTRYRKQAIHKKTQKSEHPAPQRQRSGAKGGRAARKSVRNRRSTQPSPDGEHIHPPECITSNPRIYPTCNYTTSRTNYIRPLSATTPRLSLGLEDFSRIIDCNPLSSENPIFYHDDTPYHRQAADRVSTDLDTGLGLDYDCEVPNYRLE